MIKGRTYPGFYKEFKRPYTIELVKNGLPKDVVMIPDFILDDIRVGSSRWGMLFVFYKNGFKTFNQKDIDSHLGDLELEHLAKLGYLNHGENMGDYGPGPAFAKGIERFYSTDWYKFSKRFSFVGRKRLKQLWKAYYMLRKGGHYYYER